MRSGRRRRRPDGWPCRKCARCAPAPRLLARRTWLLQTPAAARALKTNFFVCEFGAVGVERARDSTRLERLQVPRKIHLIDVNPQPRRRDLPHLGEGGLRTSVGPSDRYPLRGEALGRVDAGPAVACDVYRSGLGGTAEGGRVALVPALRFGVRAREKDGGSTSRCPWPRRGQLQSRERDTMGRRRHLPSFSSCPPCPQESTGSSR